MMSDDTLCVIPCRLGSKGVPRKNLRTVNGVALVERAIRFALNITPHVVVSTDSEIVVQFCSSTSYPVTYHMAYPPLCHGDTSSAHDVWNDAWEAMQVRFERDFQYSLYLEPSSPLREPWMADIALMALRSGSAAVCTVEPVPEKYNAVRQFKVSDTGTRSLLMRSVNTETSLPRQAMTPRYLRNGAVYGAQYGKMWGGAYGVFVPGHTYAVVTGPLVNIDTELDLREAERILDLLEAYPNE